MVSWLGPFLPANLWSSVHKIVIFGCHSLSFRTSASLFFNINVRKQRMIRIENKQFSTRKTRGMHTPETRPSIDQLDLRQLDHWQARPLCADCKSLSRRVARCRSPPNATARLCIPSLVPDSRQNHSAILTMCSPMPGSVSLCAWKCVRRLEPRSQLFYNGISPAFDSVSQGTRLHCQLINAILCPRLDNRPRFIVRDNILHC